MHIECPPCAKRNRKCATEQRPVARRQFIPTEVLMLILILVGRNNGNQSVITSRSKEALP
jgi:hypothetical protein